MGLHLSQRELHELFVRTFPANLIREWLRLFEETYEDSFSECSGHFSPNTRPDVLPHYRRGKIEDRWPAIARRYGARTRWGENGRGSKHAIVELGDIVLTESFVSGPDAMPREAHFRRTYARSPQLSLLGDDTDCEEKFYGILRHGNGLDDPFCLDFFNVGFPTPDLSDFAFKVDLLKLAVTADPTVEKIEDEYRPRLKLAAKKEEGG